jgi:hypothetical protein
LSTKKTDLTIVVMGMDKDGTPRAAAYPTDMADTAAKAASDWKLRVGKADTDAGLALTKNLPHGGLFPSHKKEPPVIKRETYDLLLKVVRCDEASAPAETASDAKYISPWEMIEKGSTVLATEDPTEGYFYCTVIATSKDRKTLTLKWRDYSELPSFQVRRNAVGIIGVVK